MQRRLVGCILTRDEERSIERAVTSLRRAVDDVVVVDSESTDRTRELAAALGATVLVHPFDDYAAQRNWALRQIESRSREALVFFLDADEWLSDGLVDELRSRRGELGTSASFFRVRLRHRFDGRVLRHGGFRQSWLVRLLPASAGFEERAVNEHLVVPPEQPIGVLDGWLEHDDVISWERHIAKHNRYSTLEAAARLDQRTRIGLRAALRDRSMRRRWLRQHVWDRLPARPAIRFLQIYLLFGGFLDGRAGFRRALFEAWQEMTTDLKAEQLQRERTGARG